MNVSFDRNSLTILFPIDLEAPPADDTVSDDEHDEVLWATVPIESLRPLDELNASET